MDFQRLFSKNKVVVAPMAGLTNTAFRLVLNEFEPALIYTEMVSDQAINFRNEKTLDMCEITPEEKRVVLQLFGSSVETIQAATAYVTRETQAVMLDLNMGCPVPKVIKNGAGAKLMCTPEKAFAMVAAMRAATTLPISVKIRAGWDVEHKNAVEFARGLEQAGAHLIAIHGRTRGQMYHGAVDLDIIKAVKDAVKIPVIGNGDILTPEDAKDMLEVTGVDAVMVGRGLKGNPWLIKQIRDYLETGSYNATVSLDERIAMLKRHTELLIQHKSEAVALQEMRGHGAWYLKGLPHAAQMKRALMQVSDKETLFDLLDRYREKLHEKT